MKRTIVLISFLTLLLSSIFAKPIAYGINISDKITDLAKMGCMITQNSEGLMLVEIEEGKKSLEDKLIKNFYIGFNDSDIIAIALEYVDSSKYEDILGIIERDHGKGMRGAEIENYTKKYKKEPSDEEAIKLLFSGQLFDYITSFAIAQIAIELEEDDEIKDLTLWTKNDMSIFLTISDENEISSFFINTKEILDLMNSETLKNLTH